MARLSVYDPFAQVFPELLRGVLGPTKGAERAPLEVRLDVSEAAGEYTVHAELPGVEKEGIHVEIDGNRVSISGEVKRHTEQKDGERVLHSERYYGSVARSFTLAADVDEGKSLARFENGVLTLVLPKKTATGARKLAIQ